MIGMLGCFSFQIARPMHIHILKLLRIQILLSM